IRVRSRSIRAGARWGSGGGLSEAEPTPDAVERGEELRASLADASRGAEGAERGHDEIREDRHRAQSTDEAAVESGERLSRKEAPEERDALEKAAALDVLLREGSSGHHEDSDRDEDRAETEAEEEEREERDDESVGVLKPDRDD